MFKCFECGHLFEHGEERRVVEAHGEEYLACPVCGNAYDETIQCKRCGAHHFEDDLYNGLCTECIGELMTLPNMKQYLEDVGLEEDFYIGEVYKSNFEYVSPELLDLARCAFNKMTIKEVLDAAEPKGNVPDGYESPQTVMMRKFIVDDHYGLYNFAEWWNKKEDKKNG